MKRILLTGGGTGGHIYPLIAVAESLSKNFPQKFQVYYLGPRHSLNNQFGKLGIKVYNLTSSKIRRYFSIENFIDIPKFLWSIFQALFRLYFIMPDVVFSKGGPGALAVILAAKFYSIPIIIHESDAVPGLTNRLSAKFAKKIAVAFKEATRYFPPSKTFLVGNPVRADLLSNWQLDSQQAKNRINFRPELPLLLVLGGSQGASTLNFFVLDNLEALLNIAQVYHQVGEKNFAETKQLAETLLKNMDEDYRKRYRFVPTLDTENLKYALEAADLILSRAGAGAIYEIAAFGKPSILVPLNNAANDHQKKNAYEYSASGAAIVIEEPNFTINTTLIQIKSVLENKQKYEAMAVAAKSFFKPQAAETIAHEIIKLIGL